MFKTYLRLLGFAKPIEKYAIPYFFYAAFYALFNTINFVLIIPILTTLFDPEYEFQPVYELPHHLGINQETFAQLIGYLYTKLFGTDFSVFRILVLLALTVIVTSLLSNTFRYLSSWTIENMRTRTLQRIRNEVFDNVMNMHVGFFSDQRKGDVISKITNDVSVVQFCITNTLQVAFREPLLIIGYLVAMILISWELALFSILFLPVVALLIGRIVKKLRHPAKTSQKRMGDMVSTLDESLSGIKVIKSYNATEYIKEKFHAINADFSRLLLSMVRRQQLASPMSEFLGISAAGVILIFGGMLVVRGSLDAGGFVAFLAMFSQITRPVRTFIDQFATINQGIAAGERIFTLLDARSEVEDKPDAIQMKGLRDKIEFRNVHFSYDGSREVIVRDSPRPDRSPRGPLGRRQIDAQRTYPPLLRPHGGRDSHRRHLAARLRPGESARPHERRGAGYDSLQRHHREQHRHGPPRRHARGDCRGGQGGQRRQLHPRGARRLCHQHR